MVNIFRATEEVFDTFRSLLLTFADYLYFIKKSGVIFILQQIEVLFTVIFIKRPQVK